MTRTRIFDESTPARGGGIKGGGRPKWPGGEARRFSIAPTSRAFGRRGRRAGLLAWVRVGISSHHSRELSNTHINTARIRSKRHTGFSIRFTPGSHFTLNLLYAQNESGVSFGPRKGEVHTFFWNSSFGGAGALSL